MHVRDAQRRGLRALAGTSCGSPVGVPFAFSSPGRNLELLNPTDRVHDNQSLVIVGKSGAGRR